MLAPYWATDEVAQWCVVVTMRRAGRVFSRVLGPFPTQLDARRQAARARRHFKAAVASRQRTELVGVSVEPLWEDLILD